MTRRFRPSDAGRRFKLLKDGRIGELEFPVTDTPGRGRLHCHDQFGRPQCEAVGPQDVRVPWYLLGDVTHWRVTQAWRRCVCAMLDHRWEHTMFRERVCLRCGFVDENEEHAP